MEREELFPIRASEHSSVRPDTKPGTPRLWPINRNVLRSQPTFGGQVCGLANFRCLSPGRVRKFHGGEAMQGEEAEVKQGGKQRSSDELDAFGHSLSHPSFAVILLRRTGALGGLF